MGSARDLGRQKQHYLGALKGSADFGKGRFTESVKWVLRTPVDTRCDTNECTFVGQYNRFFVSGNEIGHCAGERGGARVGERTGRRRSMLAPVLTKVKVSTAGSGSSAMLGTDHSPKHRILYFVPGAALLDHQRLRVTIKEAV